MIIFEKVAMPKTDIDNTKIPSVRRRVYNKGEIKIIVAEINISKYLLIKILIFFRGKDRKT